jgi:hypothetical protein
MRSLLMGFFIFAMHFHPHRKFSDEQTDPDHITF